MGGGLTRTSRAGGRRFGGGRGTTASRSWSGRRGGRWRRGGGTGLELQGRARRRDVHYQTWANASALGSRGDRGESTSASRSGGPDEVEAVGVASTWRAGSPYDGEIFTLALPALFSVLIDPLMSIVDTAIIGRIGVNELAGTGLAGLLWASFTVALFSFLATAVTPLVSGANARKDADSVSRTICVGLWLALSIGTALFALKFAGARWFLENVFTSSPEVVGNAMRYLDCRIFSVHATLAQLVCIGALRGLKDTRTILWATVAANALNCVLDCLFIFGFGWGVAGAATSSAISTTLSCGLLLSALVRRGVLRPGDLVPPPSLEEGAPVLGAGIALSSKSVVTMYTVGLASQAIASLGAVSLAAHEIIKQLFFFCYIAVEPLSVAGQSLVAESLGRRQVSRARGIAIRLVQLAVGLGATMGLLIYFLGPRIVHVFTKDAEAVRIALTVLGVVCFFQPLDALMLAQEGVLLGAREHAYISRSVIATSLTCFCALYLVTRTLGLPYTLLHVWLCVKILTMGRILFSSARLYASRHSPILVAAEAEAKEEINL